MRVSVTGLSEREVKIVEEIHPYIWGNQAIIETHLRNAFEVTSQKRQSLINGKKMNYMTEKAGLKKPQKTLEGSSSKKHNLRNSQQKKTMKRSHNEGSVPVAGNCNSVTCLNNMLELQKMDKDIVRNYLQQTSRTDARIRLGGLYTSPPVALKSLDLS